jgi:hypothetical protein
VGAVLVPTLKLASGVKVVVFAHLDRPWRWLPAAAMGEPMLLVRSRADLEALCKELGIPLEEVR